MTSVIMMDKDDKVVSDRNEVWHVFSWTANHLVENKNMIYVHALQPKQHYCIFTPVPMTHLSSSF